MKIRRLLMGLWMLILAAILIHAPEASAGTFPRVNARSAILMDMSDGRVLYEQNADEKIAPASITKILTLYIVNEYLREGRVEPWDKVLISREAARTGGAHMHIRAGEHVPLEELMKGMAVASGNNACVAVAEYLGGDVDSFVRLMNKKAHELGMANSEFKTPNGMPAEGQFVTARDMLKLSKNYLETFPEALTIHSMQTYTYNNHTNHNANRLLGRYEGADGLKTGFVNDSRYNIVATAKRGNTRLLAVVLGSNTAGIRTRETAKLLEEGFRSISPTLACNGPLLAALPTDAPAKKGKALASRKSKVVAEADERKSAQAGEESLRKSSKHAAKESGKKVASAKKSQEKQAGKKSSAKVASKKSKNKNSKYSAIRTSKS